MAVKEIDLKKIQLKGLDSKLLSFEQEIFILSKLSHRNIVKYIGTIKSKDNCLQIILEYCIGGSIAKLLEQYKSFSEQVISKYTKQVLEGLEFLHFNNIIHRDIKGGNILVDRDGICKLSDFGGSKIIVEELESQFQNSFKGTPNWMAPEIIKTQEYSRYSDIWSLGCTIIEMLTGEPPWPNFKNHMAALYHILKTETPPPIPEIASNNLKDFLERCLRMSPKERPNVCELLKHPFILEPQINTLNSIILEKGSVVGKQRNANEINIATQNTNKANISLIGVKLGNAFNKGQLKDFSNDPFPSTANKSVLLQQQKFTSKTRSDFNFEMV